MRKNWLVVALIGLSIVATAQEKEQLFYYLKVSSANVSINCYINGFPVYEIDNEGQVTNQIPVNLSLIGKDNILTIEAMPEGENAFVKGNIAAYGGGEMVSTDDNKQGIVSFDFMVTDSVGEEFKFDNEQFDYSATIKHLPPITDIDELKEYGVKIQALIGAKKTKKLIEEMSPKIEDTAEAFSVDASIMYENMEQVLANNIFNTQWQKVEREQIVPVSYNDGKIWELTLEGDKPLIYAEEADGGSAFMKIYVARIDGQLRVVR
ncbi:hypothetical protein E1176_10835 [Fulvivirga sp. RKSG066]|uniref:hypothetical protein n=1 Tax=Fulvivirga aurantia TaxID=2529383 RepID=UPI0012BC6025|nr:hypothetical protein [Fulvivirga aurantia]MTI21514.1 hypothetical protein [Fulvivirga aurantia]